MNHIFTFLILETLIILLYYIQAIVQLCTFSERDAEMKVVNIKLSLLENAKLFADIASRYPFDIDLRVGRYVVDGKSVLGVCSLDMSKPITVEIYDDNCQALLDEIKPFIIR